MEGGQGGLRGVTKWQQIWGGSPGAEASGKGNSMVGAGRRERPPAQTVLLHQGSWSHYALYGHAQPCTLPRGISSPRVRAAQFPTSLGQPLFLFARVHPGGTGGSEQQGWKPASRSAY